MPVLLDQLVYSYNGVTMNQNWDGTGSFIDIESIDGLDMPDIQTNQQNNDNDHGSYLDARWFQGRTIVVKGTYYTSNEKDIDAFKTAFLPQSDPTPFYINHPGMDTPRAIYCKPFQPLKYTIDPLYTIGQVPFQFTLFAEDPTIYSADTTVVGPVVMWQAGVSVGRTYPRTYPLMYVVPVTAPWPVSDVFPADDTWPTATGTGTQSLTEARVVNKGNFASGPIISVIGPASNPVIFLKETGEYVKVNVTLVSTDSMIIDMKLRTVYVNGASRRNKVTPDSTWWLLQNGSWTVQYRADTFQDGATMFVSYASAWM